MVVKKRKQCKQMIVKKRKQCKQMIVKKRKGDWEQKTNLGYLSPCRDSVPPKKLGDKMLNPLNKRK